MIMSALAHRRLGQAKKTKPYRGLAFSAVAGCLMGFFYPQLLAAVSPDFSTRAIQPGLLTPYTALVLFAIGLLGSNFVFNTIFMRAGKVTYGDYFRGRARLHSLGIPGWMHLDAGAQPELDRVGSGGAGHLLRARPRRDAGGSHLGRVHLARIRWTRRKGTWTLITLMFAGYVAGLVLIGAASL